MPSELFSENSGRSVPTVRGEEVPLVGDRPDAPRGYVLEADPVTGRRYVPDAKPEDERYTYTRQLPELLSPLPPTPPEPDEYRPRGIMNPAVTGGIIALFVFVLVVFPLLLWLSHAVLGVP